jgi:hypothetical protein
MMNRQILRAFSFSLLAIGYCTSQAAWTCTGPVAGTFIDAKTGNVAARSIGTVLDPVFCSTKDVVNGIDPVACKSVFATLMAAQISGRDVTFWVENTAKTCDTLERWRIAEGFYAIRME